MLSLPFSHSRRLRLAPSLVLLVSTAALGCSVDDNTSLYAQQRQLEAVAQDLTDALRIDAATLADDEVTPSTVGARVLSYSMPVVVQPGTSFDVDLVLSGDATEAAWVFTNALSNWRVPISDDGSGLVRWGVTLDVPDDTRVDASASLALRSAEGSFGPTAPLQLVVRPSEDNTLNATAQVLVSTGLSCRSLRFAEIDGVEHLFVGGSATEGNATLGRVTAWNLAEGVPAASLEGHSAAVTSMDYSDATGLLATGSADRTVRVWQPDGTLVATLGEHQEEVRAVRFNPDGTALLSAGWDGRVRVHDTVTWQQVNQSDDIGPISALEFSPPGLEPTFALATGRVFGDGSLVWWRLSDVTAATVAGEPPQPAHTVPLPGQVTAIAYTLDGARLAGAYGLGSIAVVDVDTGETLVNLNPPCSGTTCVEQASALGTSNIAAPLDVITGLAFAGTDNSLIAASHSGVVGAWDLTAGRMSNAAQLPFQATATAFGGPAATTLAFGNRAGIPRVIRLDLASLQAPAQ